MYVGVAYKQMMICLGAAHNQMSISVRGIRTSCTSKKSAVGDTAHKSLKEELNQRLQ